MTETVPFVPIVFTPEFRENPYPFYQTILENDVSMIDLGKFPGEYQQAFIARHEHVSALLRDPRVVHESPNNNWTPPENWREWFEMTSDWMLFRDPPVHTRLRGLVNKAFTPQAINRLRTQIEAIASELLDNLPAGQVFDLIAQYAFELPVQVIASMLGVPKADRAQFHAWSHVLAEAIDFRNNDDVLDQATQVARDMTAYLHGLIEQKRRQPTEDILSGLVEAEDNGDRLSEKEIIATCSLLLFAGHETTVNLIGNGTLALLQHPDQLTLLRNNWGLLPNAVEEILRYDGPVQVTSRVLHDDVQVGATTLTKGQHFTLVLGAANRDPRQFSDPDRFDITRKDIRHLTFGGGIHYCVGAPLARMEGQIGLATLFQRIPNLQLTDAPLNWRGLMVLRGLEALLVKGS